jgi:hypothetical protein
MTPSSPRRQASRNSALPCPSRNSVQRTRSDHATASRRRRLRSESGSPVRSRPSSQSRSKRKSDAGNCSARAQLSAGSVRWKALPQGAEAGAALLVEADDLAVHHRRPGQGLPQGGGHVREEGLLWPVVAAEQGEAPAVEPAQDAEPVELRLEDPVRVIERGGDEGGRHGPVGGGDRGDCPADFGEGVRLAIRVPLVRALHSRGKLRTAAAAPTPALVFPGAARAVGHAGRCDSPNLAPRERHRQGTGDALC